MCFERGTLNRPGLRRRCVAYGLFYLEVTSDILRPQSLISHLPLGRAPASNPAGIGQTFTRTLYTASGPTLCV